MATHFSANQQTVHQGTIVGVTGTITVNDALANVEKPICRLSTLLIVR